MGANPAQHPGLRLPAIDQALRTLFFNAPIALFAIDRDGIITVSEGGLVPQIGFQPGEVVGRSVFELYADVPWVVSSVSRALKGEALRVTEEFDGRWLDTQYVPIMDPAGHPDGLIGFAIDVTETKRSELAREASLMARYDEAERATRARDEILSIASHDLKTPLTSLCALIEIVQRLVSSDCPQLASRVSPLVDRGLQEARHVVDLIDTLLDVSRIRCGRLELAREPVDLSELARQVVELYRRSSHACEIGFESAGPVIGSWDRVRIEQVIGNLLSNATKFGLGKPVEVRVDSSAPGRARLLVCDQGPGILAEDQDRIFNRFDQGAPGASRGGLGLGLYIVRQVVEAHGGAVRCESEPGRGARFWVELPGSPTLAPG